MNLEALKSFRKDKKKSLQDMAEALGLQTAGGYSRLETGDTKIKAEMLPSIANALEISIDDLTGMLFCDYKLEQSSNINKEINSA
jgi:transcriptional regulator with XRE-family HTH domain